MGSKLQTQISLSTMDSENISFAQSMGYLIPLLEMIKKFKSSFYERFYTCLCSSYQNIYWNTWWILSIFSCFKRQWSVPTNCQNEKIYLLILNILVCYTIGLGGMWPLGKLTFKKIYPLINLRISLPKGSAKISLRNHERLFWHGRNLVICFQAGDF